MNTKTRRRLSILVVSLIIIGFIFVFQTRSHELFQPQISTALSSLNKNDIQSLVFTTDKSSSTVYKKNNQWYTKKNGIEYKVDEKRIQYILDTLFKLSKDNLASNNKDKQKDLGIGTQKVVIKANNQTQTIYIGSPTPLYGNYVKFNNDNEVYSADNLSSVLYPEDYRDLSINAVTDEDMVTKVKSTTSTDSFTLTKEKNDWMLGDQKANMEKVSFFINDLKTLRAEDIGLLESSNVPTIATLTISEGNKQTELTVLQSDDTYYIKKSNDPNYYQIPAGSATSIIKTEADLL